MCANCWKVQVNDTRPRTTPSKISQNVWELGRIGRIRLWQMQGDTYQMWIGMKTTLNWVAIRSYDGFIWFP